MDDDIFLLKSDSDAQDQMPKEDDGNNETDVALIPSKRKKRTHKRKNKKRKSRILQTNTFFLDENKDENVEQNNVFMLQSSSENSQTFVIDDEMETPICKKANFVIETPKTETKMSQIPLPDLTEIKTNETDPKNDDISAIPPPESKVIANSIYQTPKRIILSTNRKKTQSSFEYLVLDSLDRSLNELSMDFIEEFQFYVHQAFSFDDIIDNFVVSLNSEIFDIMSTMRINQIDEDESNNLKSIFDAEFPQLPESHNYHKNKLDHSLPIDIKLIKNNFILNQQIIDDIKAERTSVPNEVDITDIADQLKELEYRKVEFDAIDSVQNERSHYFEKNINDIKMRQSMLIDRKFKENIETGNDTFIQSSIENIIDQIQTLNNDEDLSVIFNSYEGTKIRINEINSQLQQLSFKLEYFQKLYEKSLSQGISPVMNNSQHEETLQSVKDRLKVMQKNRIESQRELKLIDIMNS